MQQNPPIILKREKGELIIWLSQNFVLNHCSGLTDGYLRTRARYGVKSGDLKSWQFQQRENTFYYRYDSIPDKSPANYRSQLPAMSELVTLAYQKPTQSHSLIDEAKEYIGSHFMNFKYHYNEYNENQCISLAKACSFIEWCVNYLIENDIDVKRNDIFQDFGKIVVDLEIKYVPKYYRNLKYKILDVYNKNASVAEQIDLPRAGNGNAIAHKEDLELISWIYQLRSSGANYTNSFIIRKIQEECLKIGKAAPSDRWIGEKMESREVQYLTAKGRFGEWGKYNASFRSSIPQQNALFAGDCWELDGTRINMLPFKSAKDKSKKRLDSLYIIAVRDVYSGDIVGMHFDVVEDRWSVSAALRNAVENTGYLPYELRHDRFPGHNTQEMTFIFDALTSMGVKLTCTHKATGKARLERWFGTMQTIALQNSPFYYGEGVKSNRKSAHRSEEYLKKMKVLAKEVGWDFDTASQEAQERINTWLETPYCKWSRKYSHIEKSPRQMHEDSEKPNVNFVGHNMIAYLFGLRKQLQIRHNGIIRTEIAKQEFVYQIEDYDVISRYAHVLCCYDVSDLSAVHIYELSDKPLKKYLGVAKEVEQPQMYGTEAGAGMGKLIAINQYLEDMREQELVRKVANGGNVDTIMNYPMSVTKHTFEAAETAFVARELKMDDDGDGLANDVFNQL
jgi:hypothetical protein